MIKLPQQKRNQLILVALVALLLVVGLWYGLIRNQRENLSKINVLRKRDEVTAQQIQDTIKNSKQIEAQLLILSNKLELQEEEMVSGDPYSFMFASVKKFNLPSYNVSIPQVTPVGDVSPENLLPKFPYRQETVSISGTGRFYDLGRFVADFENRFPTRRILNLELAPASAQGPEQKERLSFKMDIVSLVKPGAPRPANTP
jgi:Tfp pilus assembly protein PilO